MILNLDNLHHFLLDKGCLDARSLIDGSYTASQSRTRNVTFNITRKEGKDLFVKQLTSFDPSNSYMLQRDATCLWLIKNEKAFEELSQYVPDYIGYDAESQVLITEFLADAHNLEMNFRAQGGNPDHLMDQLADILSSYHFPLSKEQLDLPSMRFFPRQLPWVLNIGPGTNQNHSSPAMATVLASPDFRQMISDARDQYEYKSLIHGDIKWMNFLLHGATGEENIKLIDWEIADYGDPLWDVGGIVMSLVAMQVADSPYQPMSPDRLPGADPIEFLEPCWPLFRKFWDRYWQHNKDHYTDETAALNKAIHYGGGRLIQTAIEFNMQGQQLNANATRLLQACVSLFAHRDHIINAIGIQAVPA